MSTVLALVPVVSEDRKEDLLARLDDLRAKVQSGQVREFAYCAIESDGGVTTMVGPSDAPFTMLGAMERMKIRFHMKNLED